MRLTISIYTLSFALFLGQSASAHRIDEYLQASLFSVRPDELDATMRLIPGVRVAPSVLAQIDGNHDGRLSDAEMRTYAGRVLADLSVTVDGARVDPELLSWSFPLPQQMRDGIGEIVLRYRAALPLGQPHRTLIVENHHLSSASVYLMNALVPEQASIHILSQQRNEHQSVYRLDYEQARPAAALPSPWSIAETFGDGNSFSSLFRLGAHHIAEGTDHLMFLLALLLCAPLRAVGSRWGTPIAAAQSLRCILHIVTAFAIGHSLTLALAALGFVHVPERPVEALIAVSILISAVHALRPLFPGREGAIAAAFGLVHGLAFAAVLGRLGLQHGQQWAAILAFNLGVEAMQILVVAASLPSLLLLSRTGVYPMVRIGGAAFAGVAALVWLTERLFRLVTPVDELLKRLADLAPEIALAFFLVSLSCRLWLATSRSRAAADVGGQPLAD